MVDTNPIGQCPICLGMVIEDEPYEMCDYRGWSTGDYADDTFDGLRQSHVGHPGCIIRVPAHAEE